MGTNNSHAVEVGQIFTPLAWAKWLIKRWGIFDAWIDGPLSATQRLDGVLSRSRYSISPAQEVFGYHPTFSRV